MLEVNTPHTGLLRLGLALPQSVIFWERAAEETAVKALQDQAVAQQWFDGLSDTRTRYIIGQLSKRFPFEARRALAFGEGLEPHQAQLRCHWHLQLTDPIYRRFTSEYLFNCWTSPHASVELEGVITWVSGLPLAKDWKKVTVRRMGSGLLSAATEAGLCQGSGKKEKALRVPRVEPEDRDYLRNLLSQAEASASLSLYLRSVGQSMEESE